jgi:hypothetical protein
VWKDARWYGEQATGPLWVFELHSVPGFDSGLASVRLQLGPCWLVAFSTATLPAREFCQPSTGDSWFSDQVGADRLSVRSSQILGTSTLGGKAQLG